MHRNMVALMLTPALTLGLSADALGGGTTHWAIKDLSTLGGTWSRAYGVNSYGQVVGGSAIANGEIRAFLRTTVPVGNFGGGMLNLGVLYANDTYSEAYAINDYAEVVGASGTPELPRAFLWLPTAHYGLAPGMHDLGVLRSGDVFVSAYGINNLGEIVGSSRGPTSSPIHARAFIWLPQPNYGLSTGMHDLNILPGGQWATAYGINNDGNVVGQSDLATGSGHAFLWYSATQTLLDLGSLGSLPGSQSYGIGINDDNQVCGGSWVGVGDVPQPMVWEDGTMIGIGTLGGSAGSASAINSQGQVVGFSWLAGGYAAFQWDPGDGGIMYNLNDFLLDSLWDVRMASDINDNGQIVGEGLHWGQWRAFLITPPRHCTVASQCDDDWWCTVDACDADTCAFHYIERHYGDVRIDQEDDSCPYPLVDLADILAVLACFSGDCSNCGVPGSGTLSGCDIKAVTSCGLQDGLVTMDDCLGVLSAYGGSYGNCAAWCGTCEDGGGLMANEEGRTPLDAARAIVGYLSRGDYAGQLEFDLDLARNLADVFAVWCGTELSDAERAAVAEMIGAAQAAAENDVATDLLKSVLVRL